MRAEKNIGGKPVKKLYEKSELAFSLVWIGLYCVLMSVGDALSEKAGVSKSVTLPVAFILSVFLLFFVKRNGLSERYGLCKPKCTSKEMLYYIPLVIMLLANLMYGVKINLSPAETVLYVLTMLLVGFLEELIFRGLLFKAMAENGVKAAVAVSSITFGMGHIINLLNGSGAELIPNLLQVVYAMAAGFMFVMIFLKSGSILPCILGHGVFNALSAFADEVALSETDRIISCVFLVAVCGGYGAYLAYDIKKKKCT